MHFCVPKWERKTHKHTPSQTPVHNWGLSGDSCLWKQTHKWQNLNKIYIFHIFLTKFIEYLSCREPKSIFSVIESYGLKNNLNPYEKKNIFDLFAGSGALGLEAISRGANFCYFYENNLNVIHYLKKNCQILTVS